MKTFLCSLLLFVTAYATEIKPELQTYEHQVQPILKKLCMDCHGEKKSKAKVRFDNIDPDIILGNSTTMWEDTLEAFNTGEMPPEDELQPTDEERNILANWLDKEFKKAKRAGNPNKKGQVRRLTKYELKYTLEDLLKYPITNELKNLPEESSSAETGFKNNSSLLMVSATQIQSTFETIFDVFDKLRFALSNDTYIAKLDISNLDLSVINDSSEESTNLKKKKGKKKKKPQFINKVERTKEGLCIEPGGHLSLLLSEIPGSYYQISFKAKTDKNILVNTYIGYRNKADIEFLQFLGENQISSQLKEHYIKGHSADYSDSLFKFGEKQYFIRILNKSKQKLFLESLDYQGNLNGQLIANLFGKLDPVKDYRDIISRFATNALRRELTEDEKSHYIETYQNYRKEQSGINAILSTFEQLLCTPEFLYMGVPLDLDDKKKKGFVIAEKLSYFLWCSSPDRKLLRDAAEGKLSNKNVLEFHVERMLKDTKSRRFVEKFTNQWLHTEEIGSVALDTDYYGRFKDSTKELMIRETIESINDVIRNGAPATDLLASDHIFVNNELARHYGISGVRSPEFVKVEVPDSKRGGLLTQGTFLVSKSDGVDSHAILRGVWLTEKVLNDPPPEPPKDVPPFDETIPGFDRMTLNQKLEAHRNNDACRSCHNKIDPWGMMFENYDASGTWRDQVMRVTPEKIKGKKRPILHKSYTPVENTAQLPDKTKLKGMDDLKRYLITHKKEQFAEGFTEKVLAYALSRDVDFYDEELVEELNQKFINHNYSVHTLIKHIVTSDEFLGRSIK